MAEQNSANIAFLENADGFDLAGGDTERTLSVLGGDVTLEGTGGGLTYEFPDASAKLANAAFTSQDVVGSRALNTTYINPHSDKSLLVSVTVRCAITLAAGTAYVQAKADTSGPPTTNVSGIIGIESGLLNEDNTFQLIFAVPAGTNQNYRVDSTASNGTVTLGSWFEMTL